MVVPKLVGATQVLEQPAAGIVIFADVDLSPTEVTGDFAHAGLAPRSELGTVGLWCKLHGEAMLQAGMHHLECQFDFDAARDQLAGKGIKTMAPFTDFDHLKQAFTEGEVWSIEANRIDRAGRGMDFGNSGAAVSRCRYDRLALGNSPTRRRLQRFQSERNQRDHSRDRPSSYCRHVILRQQILAILVTQFARIARSHPHSMTPSRPSEHLAVQNGPASCN